MKYSSCKQEFCSDDRHFLFPTPIFVNVPISFLRLEIGGMIYREVYDYKNNDLFLCIGVAPSDKLKYSQYLDQNSW